MGLQLRRTPSIKVRVIATLMMAFALVAQPLSFLLSSQVANAETGGVQACSSYSNVTTTNMSSWDMSETRATGHNDLVANGLRIRTEANTSTDKAAGYYATNFALSTLGDKTIAQSIDYASSFGLTPGLQLKIDFDNNGATDGILVGEAVYGNSWWLSNSATQFVKDNAPNNGGGNGSQWYGTPDEWLSKFPDAKVKAIGYSLGSGVYADGVLKRISLGCVSYTFNKLPLAAPTNLNPADNSYTTNPSFDNTWSKVDGAVKYEYIATYMLGGTEHAYTDTSDAGNYVLGGSTITRHNSGAPESTYTWKVRAIDSDNTPGAWSNEVKVMVDTTAPSVPTGGMPHDAYETTNVFDFTWNASTDNSAGQINYEFRSSQNQSQVGNAPDNSGAWKSGILSSPTIHSTGAPDGRWYWQARAIDAAGNKSAWSDVWNMAIDSVKPTLTVSQPSNGDVFGSPDKETITVNSYLADSQGLGQYHIDIDGQAPVTQNESSTFSESASLTIIALFNASDFSNGTHIINIQVTDKAGNVSNETRTIVIDNAPVVPEPQAPTVTIDNEVQGRTVTGTVSDPNATFSVKIDGNLQNGLAVTVGEQTGSVYKWSLTLPNSIAGGLTHTIEVTASANGKDSSPQSSEFILAEDQTAPGGGSTVSPSGDPQLEQLGLALTQPFVIPSTFGTLPFNPNAGTFAQASTDADSAVLGTQTAKDPAADQNAKTVAVAATENGWKLFGFYWYWWALLLAMIAVISTWLTVRAKRRAAEL